MALVKLSSCFLLFLAVAISTVAAMPSLSLEIRQSNNATSCQDALDCNPAGLNGSIPFVECNNASGNGQCICNSCFMLDATINQCYLPCGTSYDQNSFQCTDNRRRQLTAFLLAFFLTWTGAANFYIARYDLAVPQLIFGILLCAMSCIGRCIKQCAKQASDDEESAGVKLCVGCFIGIPSCLLSLMFLAWWIADLVYFGTNRRTDGDGCALIESF